MDRKDHKYYKDSAHYKIREDYGSSDETHETYIWGTRSASVSGILEKVKESLQVMPVSF